MWAATLYYPRATPPYLQKFQSTLPVWAATSLFQPQYHRCPFQSTLPVWAATTLSTCKRLLTRYFNPRCPCGQRHSIRLLATSSPYFNPRCPCGQRLLLHPQGHNPDNFNPRCPCGQRLLYNQHNMLAYRISIHAARVGSDSKLVF